MPKGQWGCFACGKPTEVIVQVWLRNYIEGEFTGASDRREKTVDSVARTFCWDCGQRVASELFALIERRWPKKLGCATCGARGTGRVQVWMRDADSHESLSSLITVFCPDHLDDVYLRALAPLSPQTYREGGSTAGDMSGARARVAR